MRVTKAHKCYVVARAVQCEEADGIRRMKVVLTPLVHVWCRFDCTVQSNHSRLLLSLVNHALKEHKIYSSGSGIEDSKAIVAWGIAF